MNRFLKKLTSIILSAGLSFILVLPCFAADSPADYDVRGKTIEQIVSDFMTEYGLTEKSFSMGWYNTGTGETWYYNENQYFIAGSMYKLPLAMNYLLKFADGSFDPEMTVGGYSLSKLIDRAIINSDNDAAALLRRYYSPNYTAYRTSLAGFSDVDPETLPSGFYGKNEISPHIILDTLKALYADQEFYGQIIDDMLLAHPGHFFRLYQGEYDIAHKYGYYDGAVNDCGIIYTPTPFLLVAFTYHAQNPEAALGMLAKRLTDYSLWLDEEAERLAAEEAAKEAERAAEEERLRLEAERIAKEERLAAEAAAEAEREAAEKAAAEEAARAAAAQAAQEEAAHLKEVRTVKLVCCACGGAAVIAGIALLLLLRSKKRRNVSTVSRNGRNRRKNLP